MGLEKANNDRVTEVGPLRKAFNIGAIYSPRFTSTSWNRSCESVAFAEVGRMQAFDFSDQKYWEL